MAYYYVNQNSQSNGDHEAHRLGCQFMLAPHNRTYLGQFDTCGPAVVEARRYYAQVDGCYYCSNACHHG